MARKKKRDGWGYIRAGVVPIGEVLPLISDPNTAKVTFHGHTVNVTSLRLQTFAVKGVCCSNCGLTATHFVCGDKGRPRSLAPQSLGRSFFSREG